MHTPAPERPQRGRPGKADVLRAILGREVAGLPLNHASVMEQDRRLHGDALRLFGRWEAALCAAGINPARVRRHRHWSRRAVIDRIGQLAAERKPLNARAIQLSEATLASAASRFFASWDEALAAAGIAPSTCRRRRANWTREQVIAAIHSIRVAGGRLNHAAVGRSSLSRAAVDLFGSWDNALVAAGITAADVRVYRKPWTRSAIIAEIRRKRSAGEALNAKDVSPNWVRRPACRLVGSWDAALVAAGLDPNVIRGKPRRGRR